MTWTLWATLFGISGLAAAAYAMRVLGERLGTSDLAVYHRAVSYQCAHALALIGCDLVASWPNSRPEASAIAVRVAGWCFVAGIVVFCGSLYTLAGTTYYRAAALKPIGGVLLIAGWVALGLAVWQAYSTVRTTVEPAFF